MTANQWRMLEILERWGGSGTIEVEMQWGDYDFGPDPEDDLKGARVCRLVVASLVRSLERKGYARDDRGGYDGYDITEAGKALLAKRRARMGATNRGGAM